MSARLNVHRVAASPPMKDTVSRFQMGCPSIPSITMSPRRSGFSRVAFLDLGKPYIFPRLTCTYVLIWFSGVYGLEAWADYQSFIPIDAKEFRLSTVSCYICVVRFSHSWRMGSCRSTCSSRILGNDSSLRPNRFLRKYAGRI